MFVHVRKQNTVLHSDVCSARWGFCLLPLYCIVGFYSYTAVFASGKQCSKTADVVTAVRFFFKISISLFVLKLVSQPKLTFYVKWAFHCAYGWSVHWHTADVMPSSEMNAATCAFKTVFFINNIHIEMFVFVMVINHSGRYLKERLSFQRMLIGTCSASFCCVGCKALT